jgi:hypothetical protein
MFLAVALTNQLVVQFQERASGEWHNIDIPSNIILIQTRNLTSKCEGVKRLNHIAGRLYHPNTTQEIPQKLSTIINTSARKKYTTT